MKTKMVVFGGLLMVMAKPGFAAVLGGPSGIRPEITAPVVAQGEALQSAVDFDKMVIDRPGFLGESTSYVSFRKEQAKADLVKDEAALSLFKTAGPTAVEVSMLEKAIEADKATIASPGDGVVCKPLALEGIRKQAEKDLALHQAKLSQLQAI
jgi:hypothetical protein